MKTVNYFQGIDTFGTSIDVAIREQDRQMFWRSYSFNGYGMGWTKWQKLQNKEIYFNPDGKPTIKWGFNELSGFINKGFRLPKVPKLILKS